MARSNVRGWLSTFCLLVLGLGSSTVASSEEVKVPPLVTKQLQSESPDCPTRSTGELRKLSTETFGDREPHCCGTCTIDGKRGCLFTRTDGTQGCSKC